MEIEIGEYVRTKKGKIFKYGKGRAYLGKDNQILKHSKNIIDLIEEGDYVNGEHIDFISKDRDGNKRLLVRDNIYLFDKYKSIKSIVTKEQLKSIEYEV